MPVVDVAVTMNWHATVLAKLVSPSRGSSQPTTPSTPDGPSVDGNSGAPRSRVDPPGATALNGGHVNGDARSGGGKSANGQAIPAIVGTPPSSHVLDVSEAQQTWVGHAVEWVGGVVEGGRGGER